ncbi:conserved hypothetical protein [Burkholderia pseudomallei 668]|nr:conserved hypothetical protein [Burkholderia pseudomallei 668]
MHARARKGMRRAKLMRRPHADARSPNGEACRCAAIHGVDRWRSTASEGANAGTSGGNEVERRRSSRGTERVGASERHGPLSRTKVARRPPRHGGSSMRAIFGN